MPLGPLSGLCCLSGTLLNRAYVTARGGATGPSLGSLLPVRDTVQQCSSSTVLIVGSGCHQSNACHQQCLSQAVVVIRVMLVINSAYHGQCSSPTVLITNSAHRRFILS
eukprot:1157256-Pelagomonas_calceolata.AAC.5